MSIKYFLYLGNKFKIPPPIMKKLIVFALSFLMFACSEETTKLDEKTSETTTNPVYLDANGVTVKAKDWAGIGSKGTINGVEYIVVDSEMLEHMIYNGQDVTTVCTTKIMYLPNEFSGDFNQDIGSWDVSNVTNMSYLFKNAYNFNQDLSNWDVSKVISCDRFNWSTNSWTLPKPNFLINCN